jgi:hypothetical protein
MIAMANTTANKTCRISHPRLSLYELYVRLNWNQIAIARSGLDRGPSCHADAVAGAVHPITLNKTVLGAPIASGCPIPYALAKSTARSGA